MDGTHACAAGAGLYVVLCAIAVLAGLGLLRGARLGTTERAEPLLAPIATFLFWTLVLGVTTGLRLPVKHVTPWLWGATLLLAVVGLGRLRTAVRSAGLPLLACLAFPVAILARSFAVGLTEFTGTTAVDGWVYVAAGQYVWEHPRGAAEGLELLHRFGALFRDHRYLSFALPGFLSPLVSAGDTLAAAALFQAWGLFTFGCAVWLFWLTETDDHRLAGLAAGLAVLSGWTTTVAWGNFFDQALALIYLPALAAVPALWGPHGWRRWVALAALAAGLIYTYPVCLPFALASAGLLLAPRLREEWGDRRAWLLGGAAAVFLAAVLVAPGATCLLAHLRDQYKLVTVWSGKHGFELFAGLLDLRNQPAAIWGLGGESSRLSASAAANAAGVLLSVFLLAGAVVLWRRGRRGPVLNLLLLAALLAWFLGRERHPYAAFKVLTLHGWCVAGVVVAGGAALVERVSRLEVRRLAVVGLLLLAVWVGYRGARVKGPFTGGRYAALRGGDFRPIQSVKDATAGRPVLLAAHDWLASAMAIYHLRDTPMALIAPRAWMRDGGVLRSLDLVGPASAQPVQYVLTDDGPEGRFCESQGGEQVWAGGPYRLWRFDCRAAGAVLVCIDNVNGLDGDGRTHHLGPRDTVLHVLAREDGWFHLAARFEAKPAVLTTEAGYRVEVTPIGDRECLLVPVHAGLNRIVCRAAGGLVLSDLATAFTAGSRPGSPAFPR